MRRWKNCFHFVPSLVWYPESLGCSVGLHFPLHVFSKWLITMLRCRNLFTVAVKFMWLCVLCLFDVSTFAVSAVETWRDFWMFDVHCVYSWSFLFAFTSAFIPHAIGGGVLTMVCICCKKTNEWGLDHFFFSLVTMTHDDGSDCECIVILVQDEGLSANAVGGRRSVP